MRVQITYSEELENIPILVTEFLRESGKSLLYLSNRVANLDEPSIRDPLKGEEILENVDAVRQELSKLDQRLMDICSLLSGYNNAVQGKTQAGNDGSTPE
tara:strand:+ start:162 stop:461 length:300 start_codon:yes stop_codon:yes gene_type:complete